MSREIIDKTSLAASVVFCELWPIVVRHKKTVIVLFVIELWVHSLMFQHLYEAKSIYGIFRSFIP